MSCKSCFRPHSYYRKSLCLATTCSHLQRNPATSHSFSGKSPLLSGLHSTTTITAYEKPKDAMVAAFCCILRGCLLARVFGGGVVGCRGFHSSFHATQSGLSLIMGYGQITVSCEVKGE